MPTRNISSTAEPNPTLLDTYTDIRPVPYSCSTSTSNQIHPFSQMQRVYRRFINSFQSHKFINDFQRLQLYSTSSSSSTDSFANYLVDSLGFTHQQALFISTKLSKHRKVNDFNFDSNAISVVGFFKIHGFDDTHIRKIVSFDPRFLCSDVDSTIRPKLHFFQEQGFSGSDIVRVFTANPRLIMNRVESSILPAVEILRQVMVSDTFVIALLVKIRRQSFGSILNNLLPNVTLLSSYGIPIGAIRKHLLRKPAPFLRNTDMFKDMVDRVEKKLGIARDSPVFPYGIYLLSSLTEETIECKCQMFKSFGWTDFEVHTFIMKNAACFSLSNASIEKKLDFLMNELQLKPAYLTSTTALLTCSLEKRVVPRHKVLLILKEKSLIQKSPSLSNAIVMSEARFLKMFVLPFEEAREVYAKHTGCSMKMLTQESADSLS